MPFADNSLKTATSWDPDFRKALGFPRDPERNPENKLSCILSRVSGSILSQIFITIRPRLVSYLTHTRTHITRLIASPPTRCRR